MNNIKVKQFTNERGVPVRNQFLIEEEGRGANGNFISRETFQSYDSIIAIRELFISGEIVRSVIDRKTTLDIYKWDYSKTTGKYRNIFLGESKAETEKKIKSGVYELVNLNETDGDNDSGDIPCEKCGGKRDVEARICSKCTI